METGRLLATCLPFKPRFGHRRLLLMAAAELRKARFDGDLGLIWMREFLRLGLLSGLEMEINRTPELFPCRGMCVCGRLAGAGRLVGWLVGRFRTARRQPRPRSSSDPALGRSSFPSPQARAVASFVPLGFRVSRPLYQGYIALLGRGV